MQYYFAAAMPNQPMATYAAQNGSSQQYAPAAPYYQDANGQYVQVPANGSMAPQQHMMVSGQPYLYMAQPQQGAQQVMQSGQPQLIYYQQSMAPQAAPMYFHPMQAAPMLPEQMGVMPHTQPAIPPQQQPRQVGVEISSTRTAPLTSSTPLPTSLEYETVQRDNRNRNIQFRYHR